MSKQTWKPGNLLYPLPVVMVSSASGERDNIMTVAWTGTTSSDPVMLSISVRPERYSYHLIKESGEFVVNLTNRSIARATDLCGVKSGMDCDKWALAGLTRATASAVAAPLIAESPVNLECRVVSVQDLGAHTMFNAEVIAVDVDDSLLDDSGKLDLERTDLIVYSHGAYYALGERLGTFGYSVKK